MIPRSPRRRKRRWSGGPHGHQGPVQQECGAALGCARPGVPMGDCRQPVSLSWSYQRLVVEPVSPELHKPFCTGRSWSPRHLTKRRGPPSQSACEVSCRAGPWKWSQSVLPRLVSPFLRACGGHTGGWFPRAGHQEGRPASAASPFEDRGYVMQVPVRFKRPVCNALCLSL